MAATARRRAWAWSRAAKKAVLPLVAKTAATTAPSPSLETGPNRARQVQQALRLHWCARPAAAGPPTPRWVTTGASQAPAWMRKQWRAPGRLRSNAPASPLAPMAMAMARRQRPPAPSWMTTRRAWLAPQALAAQSGPQGATTPGVALPPPWKGPQNAARQARPLQPAVARRPRPVRAGPGARPADQTPPPGGSSARRARCAPTSPAPAPAEAAPPGRGRLRHRPPTAAASQASPPSKAMPAGPVPRPARLGASNLQALTRPPPSAQSSPAEPLRALTRQEMHRQAGPSHRRARRVTRARAGHPPGLSAGPQAPALLQARPPLARQHAAPADAGCGPAPDGVARAGTRGPGRRA
jgi:hypothetical protein